MDWSGTKAYCSEILASPPSIWINKKSEKPAGIVSEEEYEPLLTLITQKLSELKDPRTGQSLVPRIYRRDELFHGPYAKEAPDLILDWWSENAFSIKPSFPEDGDQPVIQIKPRATVQEPEWGGTHRKSGILIMRGKAFKTGACIGPPGWWICGNHSSPDGPENSRRHGWTGAGGRVQSRICAAAHR